MITLILGKKGSGKTKKLMDLCKAAVEQSKGNVVFIEKDNTLSGKADSEIMGKVSVQIFVEFTSDTTFIGYIKVPFFGKFEIKNGRKIG